MITDEVFVGPVKPTDLKIYYEDSTPYLDYKGIAETNYGKVEIHIPKMGLVINELECKYEDVCDGRGASVFATRFYQAHSEPAAFTIRTLERNMTKNQIEKELGYKVNIIKE